VYIYRLDKNTAQMNCKGLPLLVLLCLFVPFFAQSTHIVGGALSYEHLGGASYRITFKMYRDCDPSNANFPSPLNLSVFVGNGTSHSPSTISMPFIQEDVLNPPIDTCAFDPGICVSQAIYSTVVNNLFPGNGGYHLIFQYCCRNWSLNNIPSGPPTFPGSSYYAYIPDNIQVLTNSSPLWVNFPPVFVCANQPLGFDHSATDIDGDSLSYSLYHPFENDAITWGPGVGIAPNSPIFANVLYTAGYDFLSPLQPSSPAQTLLIDPNTGIIDFAAGATPVIGQHVVGVMCEEWRNGVLINRIFRDFQFNVINCPPISVTEIGPVNPCSGLAIDMINNSTGGSTNFLWDFGDGSPTSTLFEPTHTFSGIGQYTLTLIAEPGTNCADTTTKVIDISFTTSDFTFTDSTCVNIPITFNETATAAANGIVDQWQWDFGDSIGTSTLPNPTYTYTTPGNYIVSLISISDVGCSDTVTYPIFVQALPTVLVGTDTTACENNPLISLSGFIGGASGGLWIGQGGNFTPNANTLNAGYDPSSSEILNGFSQLILSSTGNGFCPTITDTLIINYVPGPTIDAGLSVTVCKDTAAIPLTGSVTVAGGGAWTSSGTGIFTPNNTDLNASYVPSSADTANGVIQIYLTSTLNGNCVPALDSMEINFFDPPTVNIIAPDTTCTGDAIPLNGNTSTGDGFWQTLGSGIFNPNDSSVIVSYMPSPADNSNGMVSLIFHSLNNGGGQQKRDTIIVNIIPSPNPSFDFTDVCFNEVTDFTNNSTSPDPITGYLWDFGDGSGTSTSLAPSYTFGTEGPQNVTLIVYSQNGCSDTLTQPVPVHYLPDVGFYNATPCLNGGSQFIDTTFVADTTVIDWQWNFGDGNTTSGDDPLHNYQAAGNYNVTLVATTGFGCVDSATLGTTVLQGPNADFEADNYSVNLFQSINFTDQSTPSGSLTDWFWDFGDLIGTSNNQNPTYDYDSSGTYGVMLVVTDLDGCMDTTFRDIVVFMPPVVPSGFSPNGDGANDVLHVLGGPFIEMEFKIYNNWGQLIFTSNHQSNGWDGTYKNIDQPIGVYVYTVRAVTDDDVVHELSGDVTLLR